MMFHYGYGGSNILGGAFMAIWWIIVIAAIAMTLKWLMHGQESGTRTHHRSAIDILKERYAKGEIDKREFEEKKNELM